MPKQVGGVNMLFGTMMDHERVEVNGDKSKPNPVPQFPVHEGKPPFNVVDERWQARAGGEDSRLVEEKYYEQGSAREIARRVPLGGGGNGRVVRSPGKSDLTERR